MPDPKRFSSFSREWGELLFQTKFLAVGTSLGHLSMKIHFPIGARCTILSLKLDKVRMLRDVATNPPPPTE